MLVRLGEGKRYKTRGERGLRWIDLFEKVLGLLDQIVSMVWGVGGRGDRTDGR